MSRKNVLSKVLVMTAAAVCALGLAASATAQPRPSFTELTSGRSVTAQIPRIFRVNVPAASLLTVWTTGDNCDTVGQIYNANGEIVAADDDGGDNVNTRVASLVGTGLYYVVISTYGGGDAEKCEMQVHTEISR